MNPGAELHTVLIYVKDVNRSVRFYEEVVGLRRQMLLDGVYAELSNPQGGVNSACLAICSPQEAEKFAAGSTLDGAAVQLRFVRDTVGEVEAVYRAAIGAGAKTITEPTTTEWEGTLARFRDPDGLLVSVSSRLTPRQQAVRSLTWGSPADSATLLTGIVKSLLEDAGARVQSSDLELLGQCLLLAAKQGSERQPPVPLDGAKLRSFLDRFDDQAISKLFSQAAAPIEH